VFLRRVLILASLLALPAQFALLVAPAHAETTIGIQGIAITGAHVQPDTTTPINGVAALLRARQRWHVLDLEVEGVPVIGGHGYLATPSGYPQPFTSFSLFSAVSHVRLGPTGRYWAGGGVTIFNQTTSLGSPPLAAASRLAGGRYEAVAYLPSGRAGSLELRAAFMPSLQGRVSYLVAGVEVPATNLTSEKAEATDMSFAYALRAKRLTYALGFRAINYIAYFVPTHDLADRNAVYGPTLELRYAIAK
jgi:hypothetical protein